MQAHGRIAIHGRTGAGRRVRKRSGGLGAAGRRRVEGQMRTDTERCHGYDEEAVTGMPCQPKNLGRRAEKK